MQIRLEKSLGSIVSSRQRRPIFTLALDQVTTKVKDYSLGKNILAVHILKYYQLMFALQVEICPFVHLNSKCIDKLLRTITRLFSTEEKTFQYFAFKNWLRTCTNCILNITESFLTMVYIRKLCTHPACKIIAKTQSNRYIYTYSIYNDRF